MYVCFVMFKMKSTENVCMYMYVCMCVYVFFSHDDFMKILIYSNNPYNLIIIL